MSDTTRAHRSKEERIAILDSKIAAHKANIEILESKKTLIMYPKTRKRKTTLKSLIAIAKEKGLTEEDIAKKLGITLE